MSYSSGPPRRIEPASQIPGLLEQIVDQCTLAKTLSDIADVCHGKAEHIAFHWQDTSLVRYWDEAAQAVDRCAGCGAVTRISEGGAS